MELRSCWEVVEAVLSHSKRILLYGPPSTGKTTASLEAGLTEGGKVWAVTVDSGTMVGDLRGNYIQTKSSMVWCDGPAVIAARQTSPPARLVINEIDRGSDEIQGFLYGLCDSPRSAMFSLPTGEIVRPNPNFQVIATMNGDPDMLPEGLKARFPVRILVDEVAPGALLSLPEDLRAVARGAVSADENRQITMRSWQEYATLRQVIGTEVAAQCVFGVQAQEVLDMLSVAGS